MDSYETEREIEMQQVGTELALADAAGYSSVIAGIALPLVSAVFNHNHDDLATQRLSSRYQHGTTDWTESGVKRSSANASLIPDEMSSYDTSQSPLKYQKYSPDSDAMSGFLAGHDEQQAPMEIQNTDTDADKTPSSTLYRSQYDNDAFLGSGSLLSKRLCMTPVNMKIGKRLRVDGVEPFLKNLMGNGHVTCQWNGIIKADVGERNPHFEFFRHRLAADTALTKSANYPTTVGHILLPIASAVNLDMGGNAANTLTGSGFHKHTKNTQCWSALNRADYEDMAWNLNKLKLSGQTTANNTLTGQVGFPDLGATPNDMFQHNQSVLLTNMHRKSSAIQQNNQILPFASGSLTDRTKFKYDMVFNSGEITYNFVNANELPAIVDVIVYKPKKTAIFPSEIAAYTGTVNWAATTSTSYMNRLSACLGDAYVAEVLQKFGTDNLGGRIPGTTDIAEDPAYPLFPNKMKKTIESQMPYNEVQRLKFALPAGGKRKITITLPGDRYRPESVGRGPLPPTMSPASTSANPADYQFPALDSHSYAICIACSGSKVAADYRAKGTATKLPVSNIVGDVYAPCDVQYYAEYTEHIQAAVYRNEGAKRIFCNAMTKPPTVTTSSTMIGGTDPVPTVICPLENMVRTGTQHTQSTNPTSTQEPTVTSSTGQSSGGADL